MQALYTARELFPGYCDMDVRLRAYGGDCSVGRRIL